MGEQIGTEIYRGPAAEDEERQSRREPVKQPETVSAATWVGWGLVRLARLSQVEVAPEFPEEHQRIVDVLQYLVTLASPAAEELKQLLQQCRQVEQEPAAEASQQDALEHGPSQRD